MTFDMKGWLDGHVVPLTQLQPESKIYSFIWNGNPPKEILVWLLANDSWPELGKRLILEDGFRFDYLREQQMVQIENGMVPVFGGDGAPLFSEDGMASMRLFRKEDDETLLILQLGYKYPAQPGRKPSLVASDGVKAFFELFDESPLTVCSKYGAVFGQA